MASLASFGKRLYARRTSYKALSWLYGKQLLLTEENWEETLAACFGLELTGTEFEERIVAFVKSKLKPEVVLACLGVCMRFKTYDTLLEQMYVIDAHQGYPGIYI